MKKNFYFALLVFTFLSLSAQSKQTTIGVPGISYAGATANHSSSYDQVSETQKKYPNGTAKKGTLSYKNSGSISDWQDDAFPEFLDLMGIDNYVLSKQSNRNTKLEILPIDIPSDSKHPLKKLIQQNDSKLSTTCMTGQKNGKPTSRNYPPVVEKKSDHLLLKACKNSDYDVRLYKVLFKGYLGQQLVAYVLIPPKVKQTKKAPTLLYYHGHMSTKEDTALNPFSYLKGAGYHHALNGFLVMTPDIRGFGESEIGIGHKERALELRAQGTNFLAAIAMDAVYAQDILEKINFKEMGLDKGIDRKKSFISGVSLGGQVALIAGALDDRFEVVSSHSIFVGWEILFSKFHCHCSHMPRLKEKFNVFDLALFVYPRKLHLTMGGKDDFFNNFSKSALDELSTSYASQHEKLCVGPDNSEKLDFIRNQEVRNSYRTDLSCPLVLEIDHKAKHELIGLGLRLQQFLYDM